MMWIHTVPLKLRDAQANTHLHPHPFRTTKREIMSKHTWFITTQFWGGTLLQVNGYARMNWVIPWERGLLEKLTAVQLVKQFLAWYEVRRLFTVFPRNHQSTLPWAQFCLHAHTVFLKIHLRAVSVVFSQCLSVWSLVSKQTKLKSQ